MTPKGWKKPVSMTGHTSDLLRCRGFIVTQVEHWKPAMRWDKSLQKNVLVPFGVRVDAFGFGDLLAAKPGWGVALVQCCADTDHARRRTKILTECEWESTEWKASGGRILLISWAKKRTEANMREHWEPREEEI